MRTLSFIWIIALLFIAGRTLTGCTPTYGEPKVPYSIESYNMDGTKMIINGSSNQNDVNTYNQTYYTLKTGQRLLVRFESMSGHVDSIKESWDNELHLRVVPANGTDAETLKKSIKLCPVTKNWMMFATWYKAHPFNKAGNWTNTGGDYDAASCISGDVELPDGTNPDATPSPSPSAAAAIAGNLAPMPKPTATPDYYGHSSHHGHTPATYDGKDQAVIDKPSVIFDIKQWFQSNPEGRNVNYGFILISDSPVDVYGDSSNSYSPRIYWKMPKTYYSTGGGSYRSNQ